MWYGDTYSGYHTRSLRQGHWGSAGHFMSFRKLPGVVRILVVGMCLAGVASLAWGLFMPAPRNPGVAFIHMGLALVVASWRVRLHPGVASMSLGFVIVIASIFMCGVEVAMAVAVINIMGCFLLPQQGEGRSPIWAAGYNAGTLALAALCAGLVFSHLVPDPGNLTWSWAFAAGAAATVGVYYAANALGLGLVSTLSALRMPPRRWWLELLGTAPAFIAGGALSLVAAVAFQKWGFWVYILALPFAALLRKSSKDHGAMVKELAGKVEAMEKLADAYLHTIEALSTAIDAKDHGTHEHVERVCSLAESVATRVGLKGDDLQAVKTGAALHDIGKIAIPDQVLLKPGKLTDEEFRLIKEHPVAGELILQPLDFGPSVSSVVRHHHERLDGSGYPDGLVGEQISMAARVLAVIDVYDALISHRFYRKAWTPEHALAHLREQVGTSFDARVVEALAAALEAAEDAPERPAPDDALMAFTARVRAMAHETVSTEGAAERERLAEQVRREALSSLVEVVAERVDSLACVAFEVNERNRELDVVASCGPHDELLDLARTPLGSGAAGRAGVTGRPAYAVTAVDDLTHLSADAPPELRSACVVAVPITSSRGAVLAVLAVYSHTTTARDTLTGEGVALLLDMTRRQLEASGLRGIQPSEVTPDDAAAG